MEFRSLQNIESNFKIMRLYALVFSVLCLAVCCFTVTNYFVFTEKQRHKIYVMEEGKSIMLALSQDSRQNRPVEAREHVQRFHELFFTYAPDKAAIESNIERAMLLADESTLSYYKILLEKGYFNNLIAANVIQTIEVEEIECDFSVYPYTVITYSVQKIIRSSSVTERNLITSCQLINSVKSENNPQGFLIEKFKIIENKDIGYYER